MITCYLALGSNLKTPQRQLTQALSALRALPQTELLKIAPFYKNKAEGRRSQPNFYNTVVKIKTRLPPKTLLSFCQKIENQQGRFRRQEWGARTLDIDILFYGTRRISHPCLTVPHPGILSRDFVLGPLSEIMAKACFSAAIEFCKNKVSTNKRPSKGNPFKNLAPNNRGILKEDLRGKPKAFSEIMACKIAKIKPALTV